MTDAEIRRWLRKNSPQRIVLVEMDYMQQVGVGDAAVPTKGTLYFANAPYVDETGPTPYRDCVKAAPRYTRALDRATLRGQFHSSVSTLDLDNTDNALDYLLALPIDGSEIRVYVGEVTWAKSDFVHLFSALSVKASVSPPGDMISIEIKDTSLLLNKSIGGTTAVGGTGPSADRFRPFNFGWVHQVDPILLDPVTFRYVHSDTGTNTAAVAVRANAVVLASPAAWADNGDGTFTLVNNPQSDQIKCDVVAYGATSVDYRMSDMVSEIVGNRGGLTAAGKYAGPDATVSSEISNDYHCGINISEKRNIIDVLDDMMSSVNGAWSVDRLGNFYYFRMRPEALYEIIAGSGGTLTVKREINKDDVDVGTLKIDHSAPAYVGYQSYANLNWTQQTQFSSSLAAEDRDQYTRKGSYSDAFYGEEPGTTQYLGGTVTFRGGAPELYHLSMSDYQLVATLISGATDDAVPDPATGYKIKTNYQASWSSIRRSQNLPWREFVDGSYGLDFYDLELGNIVNLTYPRYGFESGALLQVCSTTIDPMEGVELGLVRRRFAGVLGLPPNHELREDNSRELREDSSHELRE